MIQKYRLKKKKKFFFFFIRFKKFGNIQTGSISVSSPPSYDPIIDMLSAPQGRSLPGVSFDKPLEILFVSAKARAGQSTLISNIVGRSGTRDAGASSRKVFDMAEYYPTVAVTMFSVQKMITCVDERYDIPGSHKPFLDTMSSTGLSSSGQTLGPPGTAALQFSGGRDFINKESATTAVSSTQQQTSEATKTNLEPQAEPGPTISQVNSADGPGLRSVPSNPPAPRSRLVHANLYDAPLWSLAYANPPPFCGKHVVAFVFDVRDLESLSSRVLSHWLGRARHHARMDRQPTAYVLIGVREDLRLASIAREKARIRSLRAAGIKHNYDDPIYHHNNLGSRNAASQHPHHHQHHHLHGASRRNSKEGSKRNSSPALKPF